MDDGHEQAGAREGPRHQEARQDAMRVCALARTDEIAAALDGLAPVPRLRDLRRPETGLVMLRGRMGGDGRPFNLGEATVTRAAVAMDDDGPPGFAYHLGRDAPKARGAAALDALWQRPDRREAVERALAPIRDRIAAEDARAARRAAATRVDFFTLVRGED
jgi:alpha-D-ribose 1-methylphosphonate 5-triphosphate synthase subunit PhnG